MISIGKVGFTYEFTGFRADGSIKFFERRHNLIPYAARDYVLNAALRTGVQYGTFYIGIHSADRAPEYEDTAANLSEYEEVVTGTDKTQRPAFAAAAPDAGVVSNAATPILYTFSAAKIVRGGFVSSMQPFGSTSGLLMSAVQMESPKSMDIGETLKVVQGFQLTV